MANIGVSKPYYAVMTNGAYGTAKVLGKATQVDLTLEGRDPVVLYADNGPAEAASTFTGGTVTIGIDELGLDVAAEIFGLTAPVSNGGIEFASDAVAPYVGLAFVTKKIKNGTVKWRLVVLYRCQFMLPEYSITTQGETVEFQTPSLDATVMRVDTEGGNWQFWGDYDTEAAAVAAIATKLAP